tara:strand:- start:721 stop:1008 length:288 start_codon:yes stop_codon:yes gene_type:complete
VVSGSGKKSGTCPDKVPASELITRRNRVVRPIQTSYEKSTIETLIHTGVTSTATQASMQCKAPSVISDVASDHGGGDCGASSLLNAVYRFINKFW